MYCPLGKSDHVGLVWNYLLQMDPGCNHKVKSNLNYWKGDYDSMRIDLRKINWDTLLNNGDIEVIWGKFKDKLKQNLKYIPPRIEKRLRKRNH